MRDRQTEALRRLVRQVHRKHGWEVAGWCGAFPMEVRQTREDATRHALVVDEAVEAVGLRTTAWRKKERAK